MKMKINVKDLDELIRLSRKYWETGDRDILIAKYAINDKLPSNHYSFAYSDIVDGCIQINKNCAYETIHKVFELLGFELIKE